MGAATTDGGSKFNSHTSFEMAHESKSVFCQTLQVLQPISRITCTLLAHTRHRKILRQLFTDQAAMLNPLVDTRGPSLPIGDKISDYHDECHIR